MSRPLVVLLVEDNDGDALLLQEALEEALEERQSPDELRLRRVSTLDAALQVVREDPPGCVLLDLGLPDAVGLDGLHRLVGAAPTSRLVVMTGLQDAVTARAAIAAGAGSYVVKSPVPDGRALLRALCPDGG